MSYFGLNASFLLPQVQSMLLSISNDQMLYAVVPIIICLAGIHLIFRNFFTITWFSFKIFLSLIVYVQIRDLFSFYVGQNLSSFEYKTFGIPPGTIELTMSIGMRVLKARVISTMLDICPSCLIGLNVHQEPPDEPLEEEDTKTISWANWVRDSMTM